MYMNREGLQFSKQDLSDYSTLSDIIIKWLEGFKEYHKVHPFAGVPARYIDDGFEHSDEQVDEGIKEFHEEIDKVIYALKDELPEHPEPLEENVNWNVKTEADKVWLKQCEEHEKKVREGLELFGQIYTNLWI